MATARVIITDALIEIGAYEIGESIPDPDMQLGLRRFQNQLNTWAADYTTLAVQDRLVFTVPAGTSSFTIGPTGDIATQRPAWLNGINYINPGSQAGNTNEVPMGPMDNDQFMALSIKDLSSGLPQQYFFQNDVPIGSGNATVVLWPVPNQDVDVVVYAPHAIAEPATLNTDVTGPPGYQEGFMYQLAVRLCRPFAMPLTQDLLLMAKAAMNRMVKPNIQPGLMGVDAALVPSNGSAFNVLTGNFTGSSN